MKIAIGNDHAGPDYKYQIIKLLESKNILVDNYGTNSEQSVDYPDFVHPVARAVNDKKVDFGILICGSGNGVCMTANKYEKVRAGIGWNDEIVELMKLHNNANILCIPARFVSLSEALNFVEIFLSTNFEGGRHQNRIDKIPLTC
jgi:ribose 5-phosphate isomerase B